MRWQAKALVDLQLDGGERAEAREGELDALVAEATPPRAEPAISRSRARSLLSRRLPPCLWWRWASCGKNEERSRRTT